MTSRPTVIVSAARLEERFYSAASQAGRNLDVSTAFALTLHHALASLLPVVVVTTPALVGLACSTISARDVIVVHAEGAQSPHAVGGASRAIAAGVWARPDAAGWLVVPADMPMLRPSTMRAVAAALSVHTVAYAQHLGRAGHPMGFSGELYSELVAADDDGARRLMARYPAHAVEVDDPGAVVDYNSEAELADLRTARDMHRALRRH